MKRRLLIISVWLLLGAVKEPRLLRILVSLLLGVVTTFGVAWLCAATAECAKQPSFFVADRPGASSVPFFVLVHRRTGFGVDQVAYPPTDALEWQRLGLEVQFVRPDLPRWARWPNETADTATLYVAAGWPLKAVVCHSLRSVEYVSWRRNLDAAAAARDRDGRRLWGLRTGGPNPPVWKDAYVIEDQADTATVRLALSGTPSRIQLIEGKPLLGYRRSNRVWTPIVARVFPLRPLPLGFAINTLFYAALLWPLICVPLALRGLLRLRRGLCPKCAYPMGESAVCTECGRALACRRRMPNPT